MSVILTLPQNGQIGYGNGPVARFTTQITFNNHGLTLLCGKNGRGKSTLLKFLCGCLPEKPERPLRTVYLPETLEFSDDMTPKGIANTCLTDPDAFQVYAKDAILPNSTWKSLSRGTRQKVRACLSLALADLLGAELLCLDEMFSGMDFESRQAFWGFIGDVRQKRHVLMSIHPEIVRQKPDALIGVENSRIFQFVDPESTWTDVEQVVGFVSALPPLVAQGGSPFPSLHIDHPYVMSTAA